MKWNINIENIGLGGYAPGYYYNSYPTYGNANMAGRMSNVDLTDPTGVTQGPGLTDVDSGANPTGTIKGITPYVTSANKAYGISATKIYEIEADNITEKSPDSAITGGEDIVLYADKLYWSHDTDVGRSDNPFANPDENWWTTQGGSALTSGNPHPMEVGGTSGVLWIADGQYLHQWNGTTATDGAFDTTDSDSVIQDMVWNNNYLYIASNKPDVSGRKRGSVYIWDGTSTSWTQRAETRGEIGALYAMDGITYVFYKENLSDGVCKLGYVDGNSIVPIKGATYSGSLPAYYQVSEYKDFLIWASGTDLFAFGSGDPQLNPRLFQLGVCGAGGLANPFGTPITASNNKLEKFSGYTTSANWKSILFDVSGDKGKSMIDRMYINIDKMSTGAQVDWSLVDNGGNTIESGTIPESTYGTNTNIKVNPNRKEADNFRIELDWTNGSTSNPAKVKSIKIYGHTTGI